MKEGHYQEHTPTKKRKENTQKNKKNPEEKRQKLWGI
jgi:hypothetical protein